MISKECFGKEYIQRHRESVDGGGLDIIDRAIHALALLEHLAGTDLRFIFKGGTSLLLHLPRIRRLSIDIDIMCPKADGQLEAAVQTVSTKFPFSRYVEDDRGERGLPERRHFKFFYPSAVTGKEEHVVLDVVQEDDCHLECVEKPVNTEFLRVKEEVLVRVPTIEALLGDKMTAFAPHTLGVPFMTDKEINRTLQVVKQLYDIGELFSAIQNLAAVKLAYEESYRLENGYRSGKKYSLQQTLDDTKNVALQICLDGVKGARPDPKITAHMKDGLVRLKDHLIRDRFRWNREVKVAAAKAYLLAVYFEGALELTTDRLKYDFDEQRGLITDFTLPEHGCLNNLRRTVPEAFYYLALAMGSAKTGVNR